MKVPANGALPSGWSKTRLRPIATIVPEAFAIAAPTPAEPEQYDAHASWNATRQLSSSEAHAPAASSTASNLIRARALTWELHVGRAVARDGAVRGVDERMRGERVGE